MREDARLQIIANCETVLKALREGRGLQWRHRSRLGPWKEDDCINAVGSHVEFRIMPAPVVVTRYIACFEKGTDGVVYNSEDGAWAAGARYGGQLTGKFLGIKEFSYTVEDGVLR